MAQVVRPSTVALALSALVFAVFGSLALWIDSAAAQPQAGSPVTPEVWRWALASASASTAVSSAAAAYAVAKLGSAAIGALAEKPDLFGRLLIFVGLAEGIAIYGLIVSVLILNRLT